MTPVDAGRPSEDRRWMNAAADWANRAREAGNTPVGAVVVLGGDLVAEAGEEVPAGDRPLAHAELLVAEQAMGRFDRAALSGATLYSTAEPCVFCAFAIREAGIGRVVMGRASGQTGGVDGVFPVLMTDAVERWGTPPELVRWRDVESEG